MWTVAVLVRGVLGKDGRQVSLAGDEHRSVHSRRRVPTQRSANAFARGACGGLLITSMPSAAKHRLEDHCELLIAVA
jgi:hypothetical protein